MLKYRLIFGTLMTLAFVGIVLLDGRLESSVDKYSEGTLFSVLVALLIIPGMFELSKLAAARGIKILLPVSLPATVLLATWFWWDQFIFGPYYYDGPILFAVPLMLCFFYQRIRYGISGTLANIGGACFSMMYLGFLVMFIPGVRIDFGIWHLLMLIFVVKCSDIGAYTFGRLFGKHKFSPVISPKKTWEGMAGAVLAAVIVAVAFAESCDIMSWRLGIVFGVVFAFLGQLGDLAESMLKRDAEKKDASNSVPGFGGILDVVDSVLVTAPFGYMFFLFLGK
jgi:phosphatidate cytidylyltransferase